MNWKNWPYWVKMLVVGFVVGFLTDSYILFNQKDIFLIKPTCLAIGICDPYVSLPLMYATLAGFLIVCSLVGAFIGYLYGKIKNRKTRAIPLS